MRITSTLACALLLLPATVGCGGGSGGSTEPADGGGCVGSSSSDGSTCSTRITQYPPVASPHVDLCSDVTYGSNPPTSGPHYPTWAAYTTFDFAVPPGFWVHDLEHGGVVVTYNCPDGCADDVASLQAFLDARPADPLCDPPVHARIVVTPDPDLDARFAASAWGWALESDHFDLDALGAFLDAHYGHAPENTCANGSTDPTCP